MVELYVFLQMKRNYKKYLQLQHHSSLHGLRRQTKWTEQLISVEQLQAPRSTSCSSFPAQNRKTRRKVREQFKKAKLDLLQVLIAILTIYLATRRKLKNTPPMAMVCQFHCTHF